MDDYKSIGIYLEKEEKERVETFLIHIDHLFRLTLSEKQRKIYDAFKATQIFKDNGMTVKGYLEFMRVTKELTALTGIPFSLEADHAGLDSQDDWDAVVTKAFEAAKGEQKRKKRKIDK
ncbi:MAG TPA: hypothetical protein VN843_17160 [Anaerolineales bacterium]|nr:hypothetical protein [Anaerolineales bacterium]